MEDQAKVVKELDAQGLPECLTAHVDRMLEKMIGYRMITTDSGMVIPPNYLTDILTDKCIAANIIDEYMYLSQIRTQTWHLVRTHTFDTEENIEPVVIPILVPLCINEHWMLVAVETQHKLITVIDSRPLSIQDYTVTHLPRVYKFLRRMNFDDCETWKIGVELSEQQVVEHSSGLHLCRYVRLLITKGESGYPWVSVKNESYFLLYELMYGCIL